MPQSGSQNAGERRSRDHHVEVPATAEAPEAPATDYKPGDVVNGHVLAVVDGAYQWLPPAV